MERLETNLLWNLKDIPKEKNGYNVFSCFHCGGGSTMGYKLSGFNVLGGVEIDPEMMKIYRKNFNPEHSFLMPIQEFNKIPNNELPKELLNLDILDGSPPCSSFSMAGKRDKYWNKNKKFREGQAEQVLDDLFFQFCETVRKLQPKIVIAENVKGLVQGKAKGYVKQIYNLFSLAGYDVQLFLLNASYCGVPQSRERTVFIARRKDLKLSKISLNFKEKPIALNKALKNYENTKEYLTESQLYFWNKCKPGESFSKYHPKGSRFGQTKANPLKPCGTLTTKADAFFHWKHKRMLDDNEWKIISTFPQDYIGFKKYLAGMSVPPFFMNRISNEVRKQLLDEI